ncbi:unnamed protein product [marine sediment metagenome]|uniref:Uncharacterized protein n=1 Tax=marine sediment metagenome TaxID=412755 RepID=X1KD40_9ZZZZ
MTELLSEISINTNAWGSLTLGSPVSFCYTIWLIVQSDWIGRGAYHEAWWLGESGYGVEIYEECEV